MSIEIFPLLGIGEIEKGDDLVAILAAAARRGPGIESGDIVVVTHKIVSKAEGAVVEVIDDADYRRLVEEEAISIVRRRGDLIIAETRHGFVCANAGVDRSNVAAGSAVLLPTDPDGSAHKLRTRLERDTGAALAVVITDTFGRAWRRGLTDVAIGVSGMPAIWDLRGMHDASGREMHATEVAIADEIAAAADLAMGKASSIPAAIVRGFASPPGEGRAVDLVRHPAEDLFR